MSAKKCFFMFITISALLLVAAGGLVAHVDPFFHYHAPYTEKYFYRLDNERFQNDGIMKHFDYDAVITGNSMAENFKTTELDALFGVNAIKVCYEGATFHEADQALRTAFAHNGNIRLVVRALDMDRFWEYPDQMNDDLFDYPVYLYNENPLDDVEYLWNKDVLCNRVYPMLRARKNGGDAGIWPFDLYGYWMIGAVGRFGKNTVLAGQGAFTEPENGRQEMPDYLPDVVRENIEQNVIELCRAHPETEFYYFIPPYSALWWGNERSWGSLENRLETEKLGLSLMVNSGCENLKVFSFSLDTDITLDLNNYIDNAHYGEWVNSYILKEMKAGTHLITKENLDEYIEEERRIYMSFDYNSLFDQEDLEDKPAELSW